MDEFTALDVEVSELVTPLVLSNTLRASEITTTPCHQGQLYPDASPTLPSVVASERHYKLSYSHDAGASSLACHEWQGTREGSRASLPQPNHCPTDKSPTLFHTGSGYPHLHHQGHLYYPDEVQGLVY